MNAAIPFVLLAILFGISIRSFGRVAGVLFTVVVAIVVAALFALLQGVVF